MNIEIKKRRQEKMRYEVKLLNRNLTGEDKIVLVTENRNEAFGFVGHVKKYENNAPINEYDYVAVFDNDECIVNVMLY